MSLLYEEAIRERTLASVAEHMLMAARTAPKARGVDNLVLAVAQGQTIELLAGEMKRMAAAGEAGQFFVRDADNILRSGAVVLLGTKIAPMGLNCGMCGFGNCAAKPAECPCAFNTGDLGIAVGSAASTASLLKADSRVMFSVGRAALNLGLLGEARIALGIPVSSSGKSPFFDRK